MDDLIEALTILAKYAKDKHAPTHCEHDIFAVTCVNPDDVSEEDVYRLKTLGFHVLCPWGDPTFVSYRFGSS